MRQTAKIRPPETRLEKRTGESQSLMSAGPCAQSMMIRFANPCRMISWTYSANLAELMVVARA